MEPRNQEGDDDDILPVAVVQAAQAGLGELVVRPESIPWQDDSHAGSTKLSWTGDQLIGLLRQGITRYDGR
jgi:hypothetical protein